MRVKSARAGAVAHEDAALWKVAEEGKECEEQQQLVKAIKEGRTIKELAKSHPAQAFKEIWEEAGV